jgi:tripartite-type tricarboxylate transporter receptor subunit TctC
MHRRHILTAVLASPAVAQVDFPERPPRIIVPAAAGGSQDSVARLLARFMAAPLGRPIIIEYRAGAAGNIGFVLVARARPDGLIPNPTDQNRCAQSRIPMDMMRHGISISRFQ